MKRFLPLLLLIAVPLSAANTKRYIVMRSQGEVAAASVSAFDAKFMAAHAGREIKVINGFAVSLSDDEVGAMSKAQGIAGIYPVTKIHLLDNSAAAIQPQANPTPSPYAVKQTVPYGVDLVHARDVWAFGRGKNINVAVLDTGVTIDHPDLAANVAGGWNVIANSANFMDDHGHGSHTAGTIAAVDNAVGVVGVAPEAKIWSLKVLGADGNGENEDVLVAIDWILAKKKEIGGNWIVSMSFGSGETSAPERAAFQRLADNDVFAIAASGNSGFFALEYPAAYPSVMSVGAVDSAKTGAWFSSGGGTLGVMAPGVDVLSTVRLGSAITVMAERGQTTVGALSLLESGRGGVTAPVVVCGYGDVGECVGDATGKIALISRGNGIYFGDKVLNALAQGAIAAVIYNTDDTPLAQQWATRKPSLIRQTCIEFNCVDVPEDLTRKWPVVVFTTKSDGLKLINTSGNASIGVWDDDWALKSGTSMAAPHAAGVAALLWSIAPTVHPIDLRRAMELTAEDLGQKGYDASTGNGLLNALSAAKALAPSVFGLPPGQMPNPRRRSANH